MAYAYADKFNTLHIVEKLEVAEANKGAGAAVATEFPHGEGYPVVDDQHVFIYLEEGTAFIGGNQPPKGKPFDIATQPVLAALVEKVKS